MDQSAPVSGCTARPGVVGRHRAVGGNADHGPRQIVQVLGAVRIAALAGRHIEHAVRPERQARAEVPAAARLGARLEDDLEVDELPLVQTGAGHLRASLEQAFGRVAEVDQAVVREVGIEGHVHQAALPARRDLGQPRHRLRR
jgi:hypothetical protein